MSRCIINRLEDLQPNAAIKGILPDSLVTVVSVQWFGSEALELTYKTTAGKVANELLYRHDEARCKKMLSTINLACCAPKVGSNQPGSRAQ
jgi:hypothetical protein